MARTRVTEIVGEEWYKYEMRQFVEILCRLLDETYHTQSFVQDIRYRGVEQRLNNRLPSSWTCDVYSKIPRRILGKELPLIAHRLLIAEVRYDKGHLYVIARHPHASYSLVRQAVAQFQAKVRTGSAIYERNYDLACIATRTVPSSENLLDHPYQPEIARLQSALRRLHESEQTEAVRKEIAEHERILDTLIQQTTRAATEKALHEAMAVREVVEATMESEGIQLKRGS